MKSIELRNDNYASVSIVTLKPLINIRYIRFTIKIEKNIEKKGMYCSRGYAQRNNWWNFLFSCCQYHCASVHLWHASFVTLTFSHLWSCTFERNYDPLCISAFLYSFGLLNLLNSFTFSETCFKSRASCTPRVTILRWFSLLGCTVSKQHDITNQGPEWRTLRYPLFLPLQQCRNRQSWWFCFHPIWASVEPCVSRYK